MEPRGMRSFNLVTEPWIPVLYESGEVREVSLATLFEDVAVIRELSGDIPQQVLVLLRLLLAIVLRAFVRTWRLTYGDDIPSEDDLKGGWSDLWLARSFDVLDISGYLAEFADRFDLFGPHPFYQVPGIEYLSKDREYDPAASLIADNPKPEKYLFSTRAKNARPWLSCAEAARWLLFAQSYDCAGIKTPLKGSTQAKKGKLYPPKGMPGTAWLGAIGGVYLEGPNLFETLMLNLVMANPEASSRVGLFDEGDAAPWEMEKPSVDYVVRNPRGFVDALTLQSRRIRLIPDEDHPDRVKGVVLSYGDVIHPTKMHGVEQMTSWRESPAQQKALQTVEVPCMPKGHDSSRALWRGLEAILAQDEAGKDLRPGVIRWFESLQDAEAGNHLPRSYTVHAQGVEYGSQSSVVSNAFDDAINLGSALTHTESSAPAKTIELISKTDQAVTRLAILVRSVESIGGNRADPASLRSAPDDTRERAYDELDGLFRERIAHFSDAVSSSSYCTDWINEVHRILLRLGHEYVANSSVSRFERDEKFGSVSDVESRYRRMLDKILGNLPDRGRQEGGKQQ